jgi:hypothetical protein
MGRQHQQQMHLYLAVGLLPQQEEEQGLVM